MTLGVFAIIALFLIGVLSSATNFGSGGITNCTSLTLSDQYCKTYKEIIVLKCPFPLNDGVDYQNGTIVYHTGFGSYYTCGLNPAGEFSNVAAWHYNQTLFNSIPSGWFVYQGHWLTSFGMKLGAVLTLAVQFLTPIGFNFMGITLSTLTGAGLAVVIGIYAFLYVCIAGMILKMLPFGG